MGRKAIFGEKEFRYLSIPLDNFLQFTKLHRGNYRNEDEKKNHNSQNYNHGVTVHVTLLTLYVLQSTVPHSQTLEKYAILLYYFPVLSITLGDKRMYIEGTGENEYLILQDGDVDVEEIIAETPTRTNRDGVKQYRILFPWEDRPSNLTDLSLCENLAEWIMSQNKMFKKIA